MMRLNTGKKGLRAVFFVTILLIICMVVPATGFAQDKIVQKNRILDQIQTNGTARVIVTFQVENLQKLQKASAFAAQVADPKEGQTKRVSAVADQQLSDAIDVAARRIRQNLPQKNVAHKRTFKVIPSMVLTVDQAALEALEKHPGVVFVVEDRLETLPPTPTQPGPDTPQLLDQPSLLGTTDVIGANDAHNRGYTGSGSYVAVLDIGVRRSHEMFIGKTVVEACFSSDSGTTSTICPNGNETQYGSGAAAPPSGEGHGTHVAGIAVGNNRNYQSGEPRKGVAPGAGLISVQVYSEINSGGYGSFPSDQVRALEYVYGLRNTYSIAAVNMSLGGVVDDYPSDCNSDLRKTIIGQLHSARIATVTATGNEDQCGSVNAPACVANTIAVGATDDDDQEEPYSNWDPDINDLFAPGKNVTSAWATGNSQYLTDSGTSAAAPHVAGAFAILKQLKPTGTVVEFEAALKETGVTVTSLCATGTDPRININLALNRFVTGPDPGPGGDGKAVLPPIYLLLLGDD